MSASAFRTAVRRRRVTAQACTRLRGGLPVLVLLLAGLLLRALIPAGDMIVRGADGGLVVADCPGGHMHWSPKAPAHSHYSECPFAAALASAPPSMPPTLAEPLRIPLQLQGGAAVAGAEDGRALPPPATGPPSFA